MTDIASPTDDLTTATTIRPPIEYREHMEQPRPDEDRDIERIMRVLRCNNEHAYRKNKHGLRDAHAKSHGILRGTLEVTPDLPDELAQGVFAEPKSYPIISRLSSTSGAIRSDQIRGVRGLGIKLIGVQGERALPEDNATTQDFIMVTHKEFLFANAHDYSLKGMAFAFGLARLPDPAMKALTTGLGVVGEDHLSDNLKVFVKPNTHILGDTFHTSAPLLHGKYMAKLRYVPASPEVRALAEQPVTDRPGVNAFQEMVVDFFACHSAEYLLQVQLCTDIDRMPIEDATKEWNQDESPYRTVATIKYPVQDPYTPARRAFGDDVLSYNSWTGLAAHRPLGSINRLKKRVYEASSNFRHQRNNAPRFEPSDESDLPT
ncbi:catalase family protein [Gordonia sp. CPCC 205515]|uniref:catalase family protein n=1 Tax=Gordonia sp. CPCC 205515 TaxID=3140791 RepID=UPI003AF35AAD